MQNDREDMPDEGADFLSSWFDDHEYEQVGTTFETPHALLYARRSISDVRDVSIGRQISAMVDHCNATGLAYDTDNLLFIDRHRSGKSMEGRVSLAALLAAARTRLYSAIVVESLDRLARNLLDALTIKKETDSLGMEIHVAGRGPVDGPTLLLYSYEAETDREKLCKRTEDGMLRAAAKGRLLGRRKIYGFDCSQTERAWTINSEQAAVIRDIADKIDRLAWSLSRVVRYLNRSGIPSPKGKKWTIRTLFRAGERGLLRNTLIKGVWIYREGHASQVVIPLPHLAILDAAQFDRIVALLERRSRPGSAGKPGRHLLSGIARCGCCSKPMGITITAEKDGRYLGCKLTGSLAACDQTTKFHVAEIERRYLLLLKEHVLDPQRLDAMNELRRREHVVLDSALDEVRASIVGRMHELEQDLDDLAENACGLSMDGHRNLREAELEHHKLGHALEAAQTPPILQIDEPEALKLSEAISDLLTRLPLDASAEADRVVLARLRRIMPRILLRPAEDGEGYDFDGLLGIVDAVEPTSEGIGTSPDRWVRRQFPPIRKGLRRNPEKVIALHAKAEAGEYDLSDEEWHLVEHIFEPFRRRWIGTRRMAGALAMMATTALTETYLPERYWGMRNLMPKVRALGTWQETVRILREHSFSRVGRLDPDCFDRVERPEPLTPELPG